MSDGTPRRRAVHPLPDRLRGLHPDRAFQNWFLEKTRSYGGVSYRYAPFRIAGNSSTIGGSGIQAALVTVPNPLTVPLIAEAVLSNWLLEVKTVLITVTTETPPTEWVTATTQLWSCTSGKPQEDNGEEESISTITLATPLDAASLDIPRRVLSAHMVGALPPTGSIFAG